MKSKHYIIGSMVGAALALPGIGVAELEEIIVTSQFREENVQDVPITITTLGAEALKSADIVDPTTIAHNVPGLNYTEFASGQANLSMRGINSADDGAGLDNSVSVFLDGIYIGRGASVSFDMFDLERIEVLKGPQGTLFGRNSIGGAISVITAKPTEECSGKLGATVGNEGNLRFQGLINGAITENLSGKLVANLRQHDGYVDNVLLGTELQDEDHQSLRGQLVWTGANSEWLLSADTMKDDREDMGRTPFADNAPLEAIGAANGINGPRQNASPYDGYSEREASGISLTGTIPFETGTLTTITGFRTAETDWEMSSVGVGLGALGLPFDEVIDKIEEDVDTLSQEIRWTSNLDGNMNYTAGVFLFTEDTDRVEQFQITAAGTYNGFAVTNVGSQAVIGNEYTRTENETFSWALYGQMEWIFNDQWSATIGARYTKDDKDYTATAVNCGQSEADRAAGGFPNFGPCQGRGGSLNIIAETFRVTPSDDWDDFSPKVTVQYQPNDTSMFFGSVTRGFKSGGFAGSQGVEASASNPVDPETATNFELGFKTDLANNTLRLNGTVFYTDLEDLQVVRFGPVPNSQFGTFQTTNIGSADIKGAELEFAWYPTDRFNVTGYYAYLDTEVEDLIIPTTAAPQGFDASGRSLTRAPENSFNIAATYSFLENLDLRVGFTHTDEVTTDYIDLRTIAEEYDLLDARLTYRGDNYEVSLWGKNLTEEDYISHSYVIGPGVIGVWGEPRLYGVSAEWEF